jgi:hypothetical protein
MRQNVSKLERSDNARSRFADEGLQLLKWIGEELPHDEFCLDAILDRVQVREPVDPTALSAAKENVARQEALFDKLVEGGYIQPAIADRFQLSESGTYRAAKLLSVFFERLRIASRIDSSRIGWKTIGGRQYNAERTDEELASDMLMHAYAASTKNEFFKGSVVDYGPLHDLLVQDRMRRTDLADRARLTAAFNWLVRNEYIEPVEEESHLFCITMQGDALLESF